MARTKISEFSATPANNTDIDSINIAEGCAPSGINDAIRELMAQLKDFQTGAVGDSFNGPIGTTTAAAGAFTTLAASGAVTLSGGTANGVPYLNGSKVLTSGSALVFDGTNFSTTGTSKSNANLFNYNTSYWNVDGHLSNYSATNGVYLNGNASGWLHLNADGTQATRIKLYGSSNATPNIIEFTTASSERARIDSSGNFLLGVTTSTGLTGTGDLAMPNNRAIRFRNAANSAYLNMIYVDGSNNLNFGFGGVPPNITFGINGIGEVSRFDSSGNLLVGTTNTNPGGADVNGIALIPGGFSVISALGVTPFGINRGTNDGTLINFSQAGTTEGTISVSGTTVSYNGGHLSRYAQTTTAKDNSLVKGTVLSNLDEMNVYTKDGQPVDNEQLNKVKVSDTEGDVNVAGVFVNWSHDEDHNVDEINMAMTGDMIIRIAQGVTVVRGDLLMSAGDGTAKPQGDDIIRSKTVAKVTSNHVTCTYADGSYCVPCVLMAC